MLIDVTIIIYLTLKKNNNKKQKVGPTSFGSFGENFKNSFFFATFSKSVVFNA